MVNYACGLNQSETGKYFEWILSPINDLSDFSLDIDPHMCNPSNMGQHKNI